MEQNTIQCKNLKGNWLIMGNTAINLENVIYIGDPKIYKWDRAKKGVFLFEIYHSLEASSMREFYRKEIDKSKENLDKQAEMDAFTQEWIEIVNKWKEIKSPLMYEKIIEADPFLLL